MIIKSITELEVYKFAYNLSLRIFEISKSFPSQEKYSLTDQIRRSSRSTCANMREAWAKRRYVAHFISKMTDADGENSETDTWLDFTYDCGYMSEETYHELKEQCSAVGSMIGGMLKHPEKFVIAADRGPQSSDL